MEIEEVLKIEIALEGDVSDHFQVIVTFTNVSEQSVKWQYRNILYKAESQSFKLAFINGERIYAIDAPLGSPRPRPEDQLFQPGETQSHTIECQYKKSGHLKAGRVHYHPVPADTEYNISFQYGGVKSNVVLWKSPKI